MSDKIILHLDMNSYFASAEQQANPHFRGRPVGVCEHLGGIIIAPSVEAKRLGIKLGTTVWEARKIYPQIVLLPVDPDKYRHITRAFLEILKDYSSEVEKASIDEAFVDITASSGGSFEAALLLALEIKHRLRQEVGEWVSASIGIGPNKLVAKIAADLGDGDLDRIFVVRPHEINIFYEKLSLTDIPGIAHRLERSLNKLGIFTVRELANYPLENLLNQFGLCGYVLHCLGNFQDSGDLMTSEFEEIKSIGHSYTLPKVINKTQEVRKLMYKLAEKIGRRMRRVGARGNVVHYFHSDRQYESFHRQHKIADMINDGKEIYQAGFRIFKQDLMFSQIKIMGLSVSGLTFDHPPRPLFPVYQKPLWLLSALDKINDKYGEFTIRRGRLLGIPSEWGKDTVGFGRMKEFSKE